MIKDVDDSSTSKKNFILKSTSRWLDNESKRSMKKEK